MLSSLSIITSHIVLLHLVRKAIKNSSRLSESVKDVLLCGICAFELGCVALEQGVLMEDYGLAIWACSLILVVIWQVAGWDGVSPSPLGHILEGSTIGFLRVVVMLVGSLLSYRHMTTIWSAELTGLHRGRAFATATGVCSLPWKNKAIYMVMLSELVGSILLSIIPRYVLEHKTLANNDPNKVIRGAIIGFAVLTIVMASMDHSGAMFNPTLATLLVGGCVGYTSTQHILVYWLTPIIGAAIGTALYPRITGEIEFEKEKKVK
eukprot:TRINITY_DN1420_c0_g1_i2.p1 TRINITY_DN1420_c0_g1~~TRINITY_DN1420_c0_g1_i2.p1  ORF type:complete len:264 (-),score=31.60 TRINITY_DN1420_c0_g1_i2:96-887(-)